ncbi:Galactose oxidase/kelch repeat superfamily protein [Theobroma cacao]|uniref:Galactose oxidase/kelch repeat superfamily protein n=1 Tax=Theobroma cacao TaxID=3641 RepID=A0A061DN69_THECC|nr:Galactose oxidase/kelch repeat superfamily protein [Theobroma cacao]
MSKYPGSTVTFVENTKYKSVPVMAEVQGKWVKLNQNGTGPGARSSHAIAIVAQKAYVFGGEFIPRVPVDNNLYVFDLNTLTWSIAEVTGDVPPPRVGVTMATVGETIYVFGGRDSTHKELNEFYSFDTSTNKWTLLSNDDSGPTHRSYHSMTANDRQVYIFGGCGVAGRLNDLWAYDVVDQKWIKYPTPGENCKGRGGPGLTVAQGKIWVVNGFSGVEMDDVHCFDPVQGQWSQVETCGEKPTARSVFSTVGIGKYIIIYGGEVDPSDLGHLGAGKFSGEVYGLDTETLAWNKWEDGSGLESHPGPRGWCAFASGLRDGQQGLVVYGGNSPSNDRLDDIFVFTPGVACN